MNRCIAYPISPEQSPTMIDSIGLLKKRFHCFVAVAALVALTQFFVNFGQLSTTSTMFWQTTNHKSNKTTTIILSTVLQKESEGYKSNTTTTMIQPTALQKENEVLKLWNQYKQEHSQSALMRDWQQNFTNADPRKFAVGYYSCPLQAGNRLHHFFNSLIWAVVTNRTLLWKYYDRKTCRGTSFVLRDAGICESANTEEDCANVLERAEWLPSSNEWRSKWNISSVERFKPRSADAKDMLLVEFSPILGPGAKRLRSEFMRDNIPTTADAKKRARQLMEKGIDYLYGLLFHECFTFQPSVRVPTFPVTNNNPLPDQNGLVSSPPTSARDDDSLSDKESITIVLHSRHIKIKDDGSQIEREKLCLQRLLQTKNGTSVCQVVLLSDRSKTLERAEEHIAESYPHCTSMRAPHNTKSDSWREEHGPFAGAGFYQDLALMTNQIKQVPTSTTAFIGSKSRTSSHLIQELMTYELEQHRRKQAGTHLDPPSTLETCYLEDL